MAKLGKEGVLALLSDSTNAEVPTFTKSERFVAHSLHDIITGIKGRIIFATFASNLTVYQLRSKLLLIPEEKLSFGRSMGSKPWEFQEFSLKGKGNFDMNMSVRNN